MAWVNPRLPRMAAGLRDVQAEVTSVTGQVRTVARANLRSHRDTGSARIVTVRQKTDRLVVLEDGTPDGHDPGNYRRSAGDIEFGTATQPGLYILTRAADAVAGS